MTSSSPTPPPIGRTVVEIAALDREQSHEVDLVLGEDEARAEAAALGVGALSGVRLTGTLSPERKGDWRLTGRLQAEVGQTCVVTLEPMTSRVDEPLERAWSPDAAKAAPEEEIDVDGPDLPDPLGAEIDLGAVIHETLALAIDPYPRKPGAELSQRHFGPEGTAPLTDEAARPFAALAALRDRMSGGDGES